MDNISAKSIERLCRYRQILMNFISLGKTHIFSHELASDINSSPAQVRRDLMLLTLTGSPQKGYLIKEFLQEIRKIIDSDQTQNACMIGVGNLGRAVLTYFSNRKPTISIVAAFDDDPQKINRVISGCNSFHINTMLDAIKEHNITIGILTVPASDAQAIADTLINAGIKGIVNFAPVHLKVPKDVYLENIDITMAIEKTAYFAKANQNIPAE
ncbi:MAG: redox-sensing transcriptional repressor Rex [Fibrobacterales bacterium]